MMDIEFRGDRGLYYLIDKEHVGDAIEELHDWGFNRMNEWLQTIVLIMLAGF